MLTELNYQDSIQGPVPKASQKLKGRDSVGAPVCNVEPPYVQGEQPWEEKVGRHVRTDLGRNHTYIRAISGGIGGKADILRWTESEGRTGWCIYDIYDKDKVEDEPAFEDIFHGTGSCVEPRIGQRNHEAGSSATSSDESPSLSGLMYSSAHRLHMWHLSLGTTAPDHCAYSPPDPTCLRSPCMMGFIERY
jgi:hypothetical protein